MTAASSSHDSAPVPDHADSRFSLPSIPTLASVLGGGSASAPPSRLAPILHHGIKPAPAPAPVPTTDAAPAPAIEPAPTPMKKPSLAPAIESERTRPPPDVDSVASPDAADGEPEPGPVRRWLSKFTSKD